MIVIKTSELLKIRLSLLKAYRRSMMLYPSFLLIYLSGAPALRLIVFIAVDFTEDLEIIKACKLTQKI